MKLLYYPNEWLEKEVKSVDLENPGFDPKELHKQMIDVMLSSKGIGLSANQIGLDAKVFVMGDKPDNTNICINPTVLEYTEDTVLDLEGCLSFPHIYVKIKRPKEILAEWYDENLEKNIEAFDSGPGNCMIDEWVRKNSKNNFDENGSVAKSGKINQLILNQVIDNFKIDNFDKSLDVKDFDISFARGLSLEDGCATITNFTAYLIARGIEHANSNNNKPIKYLVCGGGRRNTFLIQSIKDYLSHKQNISLNSIDDYSLNGDYIESQAFGYLSIRSFLNLSISYPKTTGCKTPTVGGELVKNF